MAVEPVVYGASERPPRGDYARARDDYTCAQDWAAYTEADHATWRRLFERQSALLPGLACDAFVQALPSLGTPDRIPRFDDISERLTKATGWQIVGVPARPDGVYDLCVDGRLENQQSARAATILRADLSTGSTIREPAPAQTLRFKNLAGRNKLVEIWLPYNEITELVASSEHDLLLRVRF